MGLFDFMKKKKNDEPKISTAPAPITQEQTARGKKLNADQEKKLNAAREKAYHSYISDPNARYSVNDFFYERENAIDAVGAGFYKETFINVTDDDGNSISVKNTEMTREQLYLFVKNLLLDLEFLDEVDFDTKICYEMDELDIIDYIMDLEAELCVDDIPAPDKLPGDITCGEFAHVLAQMIFPVIED